MNRIRKVNNNNGTIYQVLQTPNIPISPDSSLLIGNWSDEDLRGYSVAQFQSLNDAMAAAYQYPDIDWYKMILNHQHIFIRLKNILESIISEYNLNVEFRPTLMNPETLKNTMFDRVIRGGERFNLRFGLNDIINFTIVNPWSNNLHSLAQKIEDYRAHLFRDDLRIRFKNVIDGKIICLYGSTEYGTVYEIKLIPTLLQQWGEWYKKNGFRNEDVANQYYNKILKEQQALDNGPILK
jgi:hypothetical protein